MLKVEARAKEIVAQAESEAADIVRNARREAVAIQDQAGRDAQAKAAQLVRKGVGEARAHRAEMLAEIDRKNEVLRDIAPDRADAAREIILAALTGQ